MNSNDLEKLDVIAIKDYGQAKLFICKDGKTFVFWDLTEKQQALIGSKLNPLTCYKNKICWSGLLKRPHYTCFTCKLRKVINGNIQPFYEVKIHQIWITQDSILQKSKIAKNVISFFESLT